MDTTLNDDDATDFNVNEEHIDQTPRNDDVVGKYQDGDEKPAPSKVSSALQTTEDVTTRALRFISTATTETLGGIAVGLAACTYLVLGRVGLVLIGALGGVVLHASWEGQSALAGTVIEARREKGLDVMKRVLDWRETKNDKAEKDDEDDGVITGRGFEGFQPETALALGELVDAVIRDYVKWWYGPILPTDQSFPAACQQTFTSFVLSISAHLSRKRPADSFLDFLTNSSSIVIVFLDELSSALSASSGQLSAAEAVYEYLAADPDSNLASVLNEKQQQKKFKMIADDILQNFLDKSAYDCEPSRVFLREVLAGVVLEMTLKTCSKPEWINQWIVHLLEDGESDIIQAIDVGMGVVPDDLDGNVGNIGLARQENTLKAEEKRHKRQLSRAEEAMEEAMEEARRLSRLIAEEDAKVASPDAASTIESQVLTAAVERNAQALDAASEALVNEKPAIPTDDGPQENLSRGSLQLSPTTPRPASSGLTVSDQLQPPTTPSPMKPHTPSKSPVTLTLHNANISIFDDATPTDKGRLRSKPLGDYLVQIEPESSQTPGWMIVRKYADFETLHEVLRRIASISGVTSFTEQHATLPSWKTHTKSSLRGELERYLRDACWYQPLAESEGMKRFLEKDQGHMQSPSNKGGFGLGFPTPAAFESMGKGMLDVLTGAPKGAAEGGKSVLGGVTGVFGNIGSLGQKKTTPVSGTHASGRASSSSLARMDSRTSVSVARGRDSEDSLRSIVHTQPAMIPPMERRPSYNSIAEAEDEAPSNGLSLSAQSSVSGRGSTVNSRDPSLAPSKSTPLSSPTRSLHTEDVILPPPPSDIPDDYTPADSMRHSRTESVALPRSSTSTAISAASPARASISSMRPASIVSMVAKPRKEAAPLSESETRVAIELLFAMVTELYTLSSAWSLRRTLLTAAKTFLLRPGNPSLSSIQVLIQDSVLSANTSDAGIASTLRKLRENALPTEKELKAWEDGGGGKELTGEEKERLRSKARRLLMEKGVPAALVGVMGVGATNEAMGRVFDFLQVEEVARGLVFGLLLQGVRAVTH